MFLMHKHEIKMYEYGPTWKKAFLAYTAKKYNIMKLIEALYSYVTNIVTTALTSGSVQDKLNASDMFKRINSLKDFMKSYFMVIINNININAKEAWKLFASALNLNRERKEQGMKTDYLMIRFMK